MGGPPITLSAHPPSVYTLDCNNNSFSWAADMEGTVLSTQRLSNPPEELLFASSHVIGKDPQVQRGLATCPRPQGPRHPFPKSLACPGWPRAASSPSLQDSEAFTCEPTSAPPFQQSEPGETQGIKGSGTGHTQAPPAPAHHPPRVLAEGLTWKDTQRSTRPSWISCSLMAWSRSGHSGKLG